MDYKQFIQILKEESEVPNSVSMLNEFVNEFPYFQTAHMLLAKEMFKQQHIRYEKQLKIASAYSPDRNALYSLIHPKKSNIFSSEPVIDHPQYIEEPVAEVAPSENLFETTINDVIPPDVSMPVDHSTQSEDLLHAEEIHNDEPVTPIESRHIEDFRQPVYQDEIEPYFEEELPPSDPHEIIRRRLNEILGLAQSELKPDSVDEKKTVPVHDEYTSTKPEETEQNEVEEKIVEDVKEIHADTFSEIPVTPKTKPDEQEYKSAKDLIEKIADESNRVIDEIDKAELEHALEASLIQSLEKLPVIGKKVATPVREEPVGEQPTSFLDWLKKKSDGGFGQVEEVHAYDEVKAETTQAEPAAGKTQSNALIDRFIKEDPRIVSSKVEFYSPAIQAKKSITENEDLVSETLAGIYRNQGNIIRARSMYEKLSLLIPEKKAYFAALISEIDAEINHQNKQDL